MVDPPTLEKESAETVEKYNKELNSVKFGLKERASLLTDKFNKMTNVTCTEIKGAMYGFPRIHLT